MYQQIYIWQLVPFWIPEIGDGCYGDVKETVGGDLGVPFVCVRSVGDLYRVVAGHQYVIAARAIGLYRIRVYVSNRVVPDPESIK